MWERGEEDALHGLDRAGKHCPTSGCGEKLGETVLAGTLRGTEPPEENLLMETSLLLPTGRTTDPADRKFTAKGGASPVPLLGPAGAERERTASLADLSLTDPTEHSLLGAR